MALCSAKEAKIKREIQVAEWEAKRRDRREEHKYTGSRIYGPRWDQLKIDHIAEIQVKFWIYGQI